MTPPKLNELTDIIRDILTPEPIEEDQDNE